MMNNTHIKILFISVSQVPLLQRFEQKGNTTPPLVIVNCFFKIYATQIGSGLQV